MTDHEHKWFDRTIACDGIGGDCDPHTMSFGLYPRSKAKATCSCGWESSTTSTRIAESLAKAHIEGRIS